MHYLNGAFDELRKKIPKFAYEKNLSRIETLRLAIGYIRFMEDLLLKPYDQIQQRYGQAEQEIRAKWGVRCGN